MAKVRTVFLCTECGGAAHRWQGQCPHCEAWNSLVEERVRPAPKSERLGRAAGGAEEARAVSLASVEGVDRPRWSTGLEDLDFVLGGGVVPGSMVLLGGAPGIGKSTLLLQVSARLAATGHRVLYVSGEESAYQVKLRADRLPEPTDEVLMLPETSAEAIIEKIENLEPDVLVLDSIQTMYTDRLDGAPGSVAQVREVAAALQRVAKRREMATFIVGHVTKEGGIAGPKTLEHIVDVVLYFESPTGLDHRIVRGTKNRFGAADEIALFRMGAAGLEPVANPSALFLQGREDAGASGSAVVATLEGTRPVLVEVQALVNRSVYGSPQRVATGFDGRRLALLLAVLERRARLKTSDLDVFLNVVGGLRLAEPAADLGVVAAVASAIKDRSLDRDAVFVGEVGLGGEIRPVSQLERRLNEAGRLGFSSAYLARGGGGGGRPGSAVALRRVADVRRLVDELFG
ncbi:MAG: DNA repair protein RadA [Gemmatimonadetes bacterium]|uniref:DNA repair protein RadA n=1 Tax=Candidatus Kutchimonas denitrificans TaxID=3056748 RepID=A0AAE5CC00_9BACT|nr:DNA repair protein RadA [Gemmatimonadota bacterium]NIR75183.1 DNA repair protein RadA [Candidatus Kutchimonas denitrificans]NIS00121.1 DNA repair protein RadA [Gemmatimonadota bacterium]NIT65713.1 DNA repair protein RadA [Gemmatimonadota bacterium]NIU52991.1 DNA repair protein RadA [Gemmatimonadota bacterium]